MHEECKSFPLQILLYGASDLCTGPKLSFKQHSHRVDMANMKLFVALVLTYLGPRFGSAKCACSLPKCSVRHPTYPLTRATVQVSAVSHSTGGAHGSILLSSPLQALQLLSSIAPCRTCFRD